MNKSKKILAVVVTVVLALLLTAMVLLLCLHPNKKNNTAGSDDDTTQTPGDGTGNNGGSSDNNEGNSGSDNSGSTGNPSDSQTPAEEFTYDTPSAVMLSADKTELAPGDTFTLTIEIATNRTDMYWQAVDMIIGPMVNETTVSPDIASNFELVEEFSYTLPDFVVADWYDLSADRFNSEYSGFIISLASSGTHTSTTEKFVVTIDFKIKETATEVDSFLFGIANINRNIISYVSADNKTTMFDQANGKSVNKTDKNDNVTEYDKGITTQKLTMSIKAKSN